MAIDYMIEYPCVPRQALGNEDIIELLKEHDRAYQVIRMYRESGDNRPPSEMGFDFTRKSADGEEDTRTMVVQDVLDRVSELGKHVSHCKECPANRLKKAYGCVSFIQYPISGQAESWLLNQLPTPDEALLWLLLKQGVENFVYDGKEIAQLRQQSEALFSERVAQSRRLGEFDLTADQVFEMIFNVGSIQPNHAGILLLFFNAIPREIEANDIMRITPAPADVATRYPFLHRVGEHDDETLTEIKEFFHALYVAWVLDVPLYVAP